MKIARIFFPFRSSTIQRSDDLASFMQKITLFNEMPLCCLVDFVCLSIAFVCRLIKVDFSERMLK